MNRVTHSKSRRLLAFLFTGMMFLLASGCASKPQINVLEVGDNVNIISPINEIQGAMFEISNEAVWEDAETGIASGAVMGGAWGLTCGPWVIICAPLGALVGGVSGALTGAAVGATKSLDKINTDLINRKMTDILQQNDPQEYLLAKVVERASNQYQVIHGHAEKEVTVHPGLLGLHVLSDERLVLATKAVVSVRFTDSSGKQQTRSKEFKYVSQPNHLDSWTAEGDEFYQLRLEDAYRTLAENIVMSLSYK